MAAEEGIDDTADAPDLTVSSGDELVRSGQMDIHTAASSETGTRSKPPIPATPGKPKGSGKSGVATAVKTKGLKYSAVSIFNVAFGQTLLIVFVHGLMLNDVVVLPAMAPAWANVAAVCISAVPAYYLSRMWVWGKRGKSELKREVLPFWIFVAIGLVLSTVLVAVVTHWMPPPPNAGVLNIKKLLPNVMNIAAFGILWVLRFLWMDKAFHLDTHHEHGPLDVLLDPDEPV